MSRTPLSLALPVLAALAIPATAHADAPEVVASIKPVHSLVARVMEGVGEPYLIVEGAGSPHTYALKPSDASALQGADLVFWVGENMEGFLAGPIANVASSARAVELGAVEGLTLLEVREGDNFDAHDHGDHGEHEEHGQEEHAEHGHDHVREITEKQVEHIEVGRPAAAVAAAVAEGEES